MTVFIWGSSLPVKCEHRHYNGPVTARAAVVLMLLAGSADAADRRLQISGWLPTNWDLENSMASFEANARRLTTVSPVWYWARSDGSVIARLPEGKTGHWVGEVEGRVKAICRRHGVKLIPLVSNSSPGRGFDADLVAALVRTEASRAAHVHALVTLVVAHDYDGIELDYELFRDADRDGFSALMRELGAALRARGKMLAAAFHPKTSEPGGDWGPGGQDWKALGAAVDQFRIMTYDHHWATGPAGPLAPLPWYQDVLRFALTVVPREKIQMGIATYGYDWTGSRTGKSRDFGAREAGRIARMKGGTITRDTVSNGPTFTYPDLDGEHVVWYEDALCLPPKVKAVQDAGAGGIAIWRLGTEEPEFWAQLEQATDRRAR